MFAIQTYNFLIGTKIPFTEFPGILQTFLKEQNLHYEQFLYYFEDNFDGLPKIMKDCPNIGPIRLRQQNVSFLYISNIEEATACTEEEILRVVPKIHRRYGISESYLIYQGVDFFGKTLPTLIQAPGNTPHCIKGPGIVLHRDAVFPRWTKISLRIVVHDGACSYDPTPYFEAMQKLLPGIRYMGFVECCLSEEEHAVYEGLNQRALPLVVQACQYFSERLPSHPDTYEADTPKFSVAPILKRLGKLYGYTYVKYEYGCYFLQKRTEKGHYISIDIDVGPRFREVTLLVRFIGAGFDHRISNSISRYPRNQKELDSLILQFFMILASAEKEIIPTLDAHYPPTPDWFVPMS